MSERISINSSISIPLSELRFATSRSGGPGGQNVNKLETRVELLFDFERTTALTAGQKDLLRTNLAARIGTRGILHVVAQEFRSQWQNKQRAIDKFVILMQRALRPRKHRIATKPTKVGKEKRLQSKRAHSEKKKSRKITLE